MKTQLKWIITMMFKNIKMMKLKIQKVYYKVIQV